MSFMPPIFKPTLLALSLAAAFAIAPARAQTLPTGAMAIHGTATLDTPQANKLVVTTTNGAGTSHSAINWQSFSIGAGNTTQINQPGAASTSINRVVTNTPSAIFGNLNSNGRVVLVNQSGITIGAGAYVDTAGFTASVVGMSEANAKAGRLKFDSNTFNTGGDPGSIGTLNVQGNIIARGGDVVLIAPSMELAKTAVVEALGGSVMLAAGQSVEVTGRGLEGITLQVQAPTDTAINLGTLKGDAVGIFAGTLRHSGLIQTQLITGDGGKVLLRASGDAYVEGNARTDSTGSTGKGGSVDVLGQRVAVMDNALIDVSGQTGGGSIRIGGDYQGKNASVQNADYSYLGPNVVLKADALQNGNGGRVIVWSDDTTRAYGSISVRGGERGGDGGFVETSGKNYLAATRAPDIAAPHGKGGLWLLDPSDISITHAAGPGGNVQITGSSPFTPTQTDSSGSGLTDFTINTALASGDVVITTTSSGTGSGQIIFNGILGPVLIQSPASAARNLTLNATSGVYFLQGNTTFAAGSSGSLNVNVGATSDTFITSTGGVVLDGTSGLVTASVSTSQIWNNYGLLQMTGDSQVNLGSGSVGAFYNGTTGTTNVGTTNGFAFYDGGSQLSTISNDGVFNVNGSTAFGVAFSQSASGTLNVKNVSLNLQNANDIRGTVDLFPSGATGNSTLYVNEFHGTKATFVGTNFPSVGTLAIGGSVGGSAQAGFSGVTAPLTNLDVGSVFGTGVIDFLAGNTVFRSLTVGGGSSVASMTSANLGITNGNLTIPNITTYAGNNGFYATGNVTLSNAINNGGVNITLMASWDGVSAMSPSATRTGTSSISLTNNLSIWPGTLTLLAKGNINQSGGFLNVGNLSAFTDGNIVLGQNNFVSGDLNVGSSSGGSITFVGTASAFNVGGANTTGNINLTSAGSITSDGSITGNGITLTAPSGFTTIDQVIATGNLTINTSGSGGTITQTGISNFTAAGSTLLNAGTGDVLLGSATNNFNTVSVAGRHVTLRDTNAMNVTSLSYDPVGGNVYLQAGGALTVPAGAISTSGQVSLISGAAFTTPGAITGSDILLASVGALNLASSVNASATLFLGSGGGNITQVGTITAAGLTTVSAGTGSVTLNNAGNNFSSITATGGTVNVRDANALALAGITGASVTLQAGGALTQSSGTVNTSASNGPISLTAAIIGSSGAFVNVAPGAGSVALSTNTGGVYVNQTIGTLNLANYTVSASATGQTIKLAATGAGSDLSVGFVGFAPNTSDDNVGLYATASGPSGGAVVVSSPISNRSFASLELGAEGPGGTVDILAPASFTAPGGVKLTSLSGNVNIASPVASFSQIVSGTYIAAGPLLLQAGGSVLGGGNLIAQGGNITVQANQSGGSFVPTGSGSIVLGSVTSKGDNGLNSSLPAVATGQDGGNVTLSFGAVGTGGITFTTIDARGGNGATNISASDAGMPGGNGGHVLVESDNPSMTLSGITVNSSGGNGGNAGTVNRPGGAGGDAGSIDLYSPGGDLFVNGTVTAAGGNGGNAVINVAPGAAGAAGAAGLIELTATGNLIFSGPTTLNNSPGSPGFDNTGANGPGSALLPIAFQANNISQAGGAFINASGQIVSVISNNNVLLTDAGNAFGEMNGAANGNIAIRGLSGIGDSGLDAGGSLSLQGYSANPLLIQGPLLAVGDISLSGTSVSVLIDPVISTGGNVNMSSGAGGIAIGGGSTVSGLNINLNGNTTLSDSTLIPGGVGGIGAVNVVGDFTMTGSANIAFDVISAPAVAGRALQTLGTASFDSVAVTGAFNVVGTSAALMVNDLSGGTVTGSLPLVSAASFTGTPAFAGPTGWSLNSSATGVDLVTSGVVVPVVTPPAPAAKTTPGSATALTENLIDTFLAKFEEALDAQQKSEDEKEKQKEAIVVEGETCKP